VSLGEVEFVTALPVRANVSIFGNVCEEYGDEPCPFVVSLEGPDEWLGGEWECSNTKNSRRYNNT
jgi:hypothetical protein